MRHLALDGGTGAVREGSRVRKDFPVEMTLELVSGGRRGIDGGPSGEGKRTACGKAEESEKVGQVQRPRVRATEGGGKCVVMVAAE